ncbi:MAG: hypothetical protein HFJ36_02830 [Clostridia bacterium]|nr:hypothetical protein [Clostridia bacterium]
MGPKKNSKIILILIISTILLILLTSLAFAYFATDMFKSNKDLFFKYITQVGIDEQLSQYFEKQKTTPYQNQGTFEPNISTEGSQTKEYEAVNNFNISFSGQTDKITDNFAQDITLNYSNDITFPISLRKVGNIIGLQTEYIGSKYIAVETNSQDNEALESLNEVIEQIEKAKKLSNLPFSNEELKQIQDTYINIINNELQESQFSKEDNRYKLIINGEQFKNILVKILDTLKNDQKTLDKLNEYLEEQKNSLKLTATNIDNYKKTLEQEQNGNDINYEITIFAQKDKTNKIVISNDELIITIEKEKSDDFLKYKVSLEDKDESGNLGFSFSANYTGLSGLQNVKEEYIIERTVDPSKNIINNVQTEKNNTSEKITTKYQFNNQIDFIENANIEELSDNNSMILNNYEEEKVTNFLEQAEERIQKVNKQQMEQLGLEEYQNPLIQMFSPGLGLFIYNQATDVVNNTNISEAEINAFNSKFENYESTNLRGVTVKGLLSTIQTNNAWQNSKKIEEIHFNGEEYEVTDQNISFLKDSVELETTYRVEFERDEETGIIYRAVINKK